jgi:hypothetical protein
MNELIVTLPGLHLRRHEEPMCADCEEAEDAGRHTSTVAECSASRQPDGCPAPEEHHRFRPRPWWRRIRRRRAWESWL